MKQHLILTLVLFCLTSLWVVTGYNAKIRYDLKMVHLNAYWLFETEDGLPYDVARNDKMVNSPENRKRHIETVARYLASTNADLIHLTEVQGSAVLDTIVKALNKDIEDPSKYYTHYLISDGSLKSKSVGYQRVAFISRLPIVTRPSRSSDIMPTVRHMFYQHIVASFKLPDDRILFAAGVHLKRQPEKLIHHFEEMDQVIGQLAWIGADAENNDHVIAVLGDFNEVLPLGDRISEESSDSVIKQKYHLTNPVTKYMTTGLDATVERSSKIGLIDSILVSKSFAQYNMARPVVPGWRWAKDYCKVGLSDHSPVELTFRVNEPKFDMTLDTEKLTPVRRFDNIFSNLINEESGSGKSKKKKTKKAKKSLIKLTQEEETEKTEFIIEGLAPTSTLVENENENQIVTRPSKGFFEQVTAFCPVTLLNLFQNFPYGLAIMMVTVGWILYRVHTPAMSALYGLKLISPQQISQ